MNARAARFQALSSGGKTPSGASAAGADVAAGTDVSGYGAGTTSQDFDAVETRTLFRALWQGRWKIGGLALAVGFAVWLAVLQVAPTYTVYAKLMLDTRKVQIVSGADVVADVAPTSQIVNSEIGVLQSSMVIDRMLDALTPKQWDQIDPALKPKSLIAQVKGVLHSLISTAPEVPSAAADATDRRARLIDAVQTMRTAYAQPESYVMIILI